MKRKPPVFATIHLRLLLPVVLVTIPVIGIILSRDPAILATIAILAVFSAALIWKLTRRSEKALREDLGKLAETQEAAEENMAFFRTLLENAPVGFAYLDSDCRYRYVNYTLAGINGLAPEEHIDRTVAEIVPDAWPTLEPLCRRILETGEPVTGMMVTAATAANPGQARSYVVSHYPVCASGSHTVGIGVLVEDITERRAAEEKVIRLSRLYAVLSGINEAIVRTRELERLYPEVCRIIVQTGSFRMAWIGLVDPDTLLVEPAAIQGYEEGYLKGKRISINERMPEGRGPTGTAIREGRYYLCNDIENDPVMAPWREEALKRGYRSSAAFPLNTGTMIAGSINLYAGDPFFFDREEIELLQSLAEDVSFAVEAAENEKRRDKAEKDIRKLNAELEERVAYRTLVLEQANEKLKELDRLKSMFIASMSHELRTPLNSVIGFSSIMLNEWTGPVNDEQKKNLSTVVRAGKHLLALINDVIDVSKIEAGQIEVATDEFDLHDLIEEAVAAFENECRDKGIALLVENLHLTMHTDRRRLLQCLLNLISNGVKYTEQGSVKVAARLVKCGNGAALHGDYVEISVTDTGIGIREEDMSKLFEPFIRLDSPIKTKVSGTGLGLYLTRKLAREALRGEIRFESDCGKGSRFIMEAPL